MRNEITGDFDKTWEEELEDFPSTSELRLIASSNTAERLKVSKIYDFENEKDKVFITYSDNTSEVVPVDELMTSAIKEKLEEGCKVEIQRIVPTWE